MRVLVANEPRIYREVVAGALKELRPRLVEVFSVGTGGVEEAVEKVLPHLILCSRRIDTTVLGRAGCLLRWVMLHPNGEDRAEIGDAVTGRTKLISQGVLVDDLLSVVDETERLLSTRPG